MNLRYLGFEHARNCRLYRFEYRATGGMPAVLVVSADLGLFTAHGVELQDGPALCARKVAASPVLALNLELTGDDFRSYAAERVLDAQRQADRRRRLHNRLPARRPRSLHNGHWG